MNGEELRLECIRLAVEAGASPWEVVKVAVDWESYVLCGQQMDLRTASEMSKAVM